MMLLRIGSILGLLLCISIVHDPRKFWNVLLFAGSALFFCVGVADVNLNSRNELTGAVLSYLLIIMVPVALFCVAILLIINGFVMLRREGTRVKNLLSLFAGIMIILGLVLIAAFLFMVTPHRMLLLLLWFSASVSIYVAVTFFALLLYSILYAKLPKRKQYDYIIVHGCGLLDGEHISPLMRGRVDKAVWAYEKMEKQAKLVLSGGQGRDEKISEAQAMRNYLVERGFPEENILLEEQSSTTYENLRNVRNMLDVGERKQYLFVTSNYHVFRTGLYARKLKMKAEGMGCKTAIYYWPSAFIREYIAVMVYCKWITAFILLCWMIATVCLF